jgi:hypothetical protein
MEAIFTQFFSDYIEEGSENSPQTADADDDFFTI